MAHYDCEKCGKNHWDCRCPERPIGKSLPPTTETLSLTNATSTEQSSASVEENSSAGCATPSQPEKPALYSVWRHKSGAHYVVVGFTNEHSDDANDPNSRYPLAIRYADREGREWSRPLRLWHDSMTIADSGDGAGVADAVLNKINPWYRDITEACTVANINWHMDNPHQTINDLINWHVRLSLDPEVSSDARELMQKGRDEIIHGETKACYDEGCPHHGKAIRCEPHPGGCIATLPSQAVAWKAVKEDLLRVVNSVLRYPVPGGWLIVVSGHPTFVPDPTHSWE